MIDAIAPASPRGLGRRLATLLAAFGLPLVVCSSSPARPQDDPPAQPLDEVQEGASPEDEDQADVLSDSIFVDPKATAAMSGDFEQLHPSARVPLNSDRTIAQMVRGGRVDASLIDRFIKDAARQLTDPGNIAAVAQPGGSQRNIEEIQNAGRNLMLPYLEVPNADQRDRRFLQEFNTRLLGVAPDLLKNHLYARVQVMQALARMGDPQALDLLVAQLGDADQPLIVKQLAAEGIEQIARDNSGSLSPPQREKAANALVGFLRENRDAYWLAHARALQALGTLRSISGIQNRDEAVFADEVLQAISAPGLRLESRAWAAWAAGMLEVPPAYPQLNFTLATYMIGQLAVEVGERIVELSDPRNDGGYNPERVKYQTALLVSPIFQSLEGARGLSGSGLKNNQTLGDHRAYVNRVHQLVRQLAAASVELTRAVGAQRPAARDAMIASLNELRNFLGQNPPQDRTFIPGGREFALNVAS
jgi:hypothetical protein